MIEYKVKSRSNTKKVFCILGFTSSGKDSIVKEVSKQMELPILVSHTSRPIRENEVPGETYNYVDNKFFDDNQAKFLEQRSYDTVYGEWKYGLHQDELINKPYSLFIVDSWGYGELAHKLGEDKLTSIFIETNEDVLRQRHSLRGDCLDEFERRLEDDIRRFEDFLSDYVVTNNESLEKAVQKVKDIVIEEMMEDCL